MSGDKARQKGFTLLELLVVLLIVGLIAALATPNVTASIKRAKEAALAENLAVMRRAIDDYYGDKGSYPAELEALVTERYLRFIPDDPFHDAKAAWAVVEGSGDNGIEDIHSFSQEVGRNGEPYNEW